jgi:hypothetical protein
MMTEDIEKIINEWIAAYLKRGRQAGIEYVQIFEVSSNVLLRMHYSNNPIRTKVP